MQNIQNALSGSLSIDGALGAAFADWRRGDYVAYKLITSSDDFSQAELTLMVASSSEVIRNKALQSEKPGEKNYRNSFHLRKVFLPHSIG